MLNKYKRNKKGIAPIIGVGIGLTLLLILVIVLSLGGVAQKGVANSFTPVEEGCDSPVLTYGFSGELVVIDGSIFTVEPEIVGVTRFQLTRLLSIGSEPFSYEVSLFDGESDVQLGQTFKGTSAIDRNLILTNEGALAPFSINFKVPDNDCDGLIDDVNLVLKAKAIETDDVFKDTSEFEESIVIRNGVILK